MPSFSDREPFASFSYLTALAKTSSTMLNLTRNVPDGTRQCFDSSPIRVKLTGGPSCIVTMLRHITDINSTVGAQRKGQVKEGFLKGAVSYLALC